MGNHVLTTKNKDCKLVYTKEALQKLIEKMKKSREFQSFYDSPDSVTRKEIGKVIHLLVDPQKDGLHYEVELRDGKILRGLAK